MRNNCQKLIETLQKPSVVMGRQIHLLVGFLLLGSPKRGSTKSPSGGLVGISLPAPPASLTDGLSLSLSGATLSPLSGALQHNAVPSPQCPPALHPPVKILCSAASKFSPLPQSNPNSSANPSPLVIQWPFWTSAHSPALQHLRGAPDFPKTLGPFAGSALRGPAAHCP